MLFQLMHNMTSDEYAEEIRRRIDDDKTHVTSYYGAASGFQSKHGTAHLSLLTSDGAAVAMTSTINLKYVTFSTVWFECIVYTLETISL